MDALVHLVGGLGTAILALAGLVCVIATGVVLVPTAPRMVRAVADRERARLSRWGPEIVGAGPVPTVPPRDRASASCERTTEFGTASPSPLGDTVPPVIDANTVPTTPPAESTSGPPELPGRISPRKDSMRRRTGPLPYASWVLTICVGPIRPGSAVNGPSRG